MANSLLIAVLLLVQAASVSTGYRVRGRVNPPENQTPGSPVPGIPGAPPAARGNLVRMTGVTERGAAVTVQALIGADGAFEFRDVDPGFYQVDVIPGTLLLPVDVIVRDRDVDVQLGRPWIRVAGAITVEGGGPVPRFDLEFSGLNAAGEPDLLGRRFLAQAGGRFTLEMPVGAYRVAASGLPQGLRLKENSAPFQVSATEPAEISLVLNVAQTAPWVAVSGRLDGKWDTAVRKVTLSGPATASPIVTDVRADGSFEFPKVLPGRYEARVFPSPSNFFRPLAIGPADVKDIRITAPSATGATGEFVRIQPGVFLMGCPAAETQCGPAEKPAHRVGITKAFEIGKHEVTQAQWESVMGTNPSAFKGPSRPVENVEWEDAQQFIAKLNSLGDGYRYRLPTEAEWEYAARAGTDAAEPGPAESDRYGWFNTNSTGETHPVGEKQPNAWGLYDMRGNVAEWVEDWYEDAYYASSPELDPAGPRTGKQHFVRGGSFAFNPAAARATSRLGQARTNSGIRLVRESLR
jgi:formylglycine-generating enzyme required for sulfatase activity